MTITSLYHQDAAECFGRFMDSKSLLLLYWTKVYARFGQFFFSSQRRQQWLGLGFLARPFSRLSELHQQVLASRSSVVGRFSTLSLVRFLCRGFRVCLEVRGVFCRYAHESLWQGNRRFSFFIRGWFG